MVSLNRVVVTGVGAITPIGNTVEHYWASLKSGISGATPITRFDCSQFKTQIACEVKGFDPLNYFDSKETRSMDLFTQYALVAAMEAVKSAGLGTTIDDPFRYGVLFASGIGGLGTTQDELIRYAQRDMKPRFSPHMIVKMISNMAAGIIAMKYDFRGPNYGTVSACASSTHAIIDAFNILRLGKADAIIVGGSEAPINATGLGGFSSMHAISEKNDSPLNASRPFDVDRDGFVIGEGAGALVLETLDHAKKRDAVILAEIAGGGMTADAHHYTLPHPEGRSVYRAMLDALNEAGIAPDNVDYINLHATSTPAGDPPELFAIQELFKNCLDSIHVSATKSMTGHLLGAAGAIEAIATVLAIHESVIPPTINTVVIDPAIDCKVNLTLYKAVKKEIRAALCNTFGFGGQNASTLFKKYHDD